MKKYLLSIVGFTVLFVFPTNSFSRIWIPLEGSSKEKCVSIDVIESDTIAYKIRVKINGLWDDQYLINGNIYHLLKLDNNDCSQNVGEPSLPVILQSIGIPSGKTYRTEIREKKWIDINIGKLFPVQEYKTTSSDAAGFCISEDSYKCERYQYPLISDCGIMRWRGINNTRLDICPFKYYPKDGLLSVLSEFVATVSFTESSSVKKTISNINHHSVRFLDNNNAFALQESSSLRESTSNTYDYLIIVGNIPEIENSQAMSDFRKWKALKGYKTKVVSTSTIGSDSASIKSYISQELENGVEQVLFVGNYDKIPLVTFTSKKYQWDHQVNICDYWYGCLDGDDDVQAEIPIGRFATNTLSHFTNMVNKTIKYESLPHEWTEKILLIASKDDAPYTFQNPMDMVYNANYSCNVDFIKAYGATSALGGNCATRADVFNHANNGLNMMVNYSHGNHGGFWGLYGTNDCIYQTDTVNFNSNTYSVFFNLACYQAAIYMPLNIATYFTCTNRCNSAFVGCTVPSWIIPDSMYLRHFPQLLLNEEEVHLGQLNLQSHLWCISHCDKQNLAIDNAQTFLCLGDPTLEIWTGIQSSFQSVNYSVSTGSTSIISTTTSGFKVTIVSENGELLGKYDSSGTNCTFPTPSCSCTIMLDKHNYIPYLIHYNTESTYIQNETISNSRIYVGTPLDIGEDVNEDEEYGDVTLTPNAKVYINKGNGVFIKNGFECELGAVLEIK